MTTYKDTPVSSPALPVKVSARRVRTTEARNAAGAVPRFHVKRSHRVAGAAVIAVSGLALTSCVGPPADEWAGGAEDATCPVTPAEAGGSLRIGYLGGPAADLYTQDQGLAEACLPNAEISWTRFPTGQDIVQGFAAGSVDMAALGSTPTTKALSAPLNLDVSVISANSVIGATEALVAKKATSVPELKGQRIAVPFSSTAHYSLLNALIDAGLDPQRDVEIVNISPDKLPAAWKSDQIDAAYVWDPTLEQLKQGTGGAPQGHVLTDSEEQAAAGHATYNVTLATNPWIDGNSELLRVFLELEAWVVDHADEDPDDFGKVNASASGMDEDSASRQIEGQILIHGSEEPEYLAEVAGALYSTAEFLRDQGEIPSVKPADAYAAATRPDLWKDIQ
ncbi:Taurine-binding periplasmic protein [Corynebacterium provencense]|uniref:Taurine-binding periplasmic protein n=1 Tax=Corynebacterium provencense TaxID=1737425 RepID=A0A2Z3YPP9_9CORY|nr:Taurine-binding periplasmic protein [Corynebacterium provencense]